MEEKRKITSGNKIPGCERLTRPEEIQGLSKYLGAIRDTQEKWISENMPDSPLEGPEDPKLKAIKLPDKRLRLDGNIEVVLPNQREHLDIEQELHLPTEKEKLHVPDQELRTDKIGLNIGKEPELPNQVEKINVDDPKLIQGKERLVVDKSVELPKEKEKIYPSDVSLPKAKETLHNIDDPELPKGIVGLQDLRNMSLPKEKERIFPNQLDELPHDISEIHPSEPNDLRQHIEGLFPEEPDDLRQKKIKLRAEEPDELPQDVIGISVTRPKKLPTDKINIYAPAPDKLPKERLDIDPQTPELPNTRLDIEPEDVELPKSVVEIDPEQIEELPNENIKIDVPDPKRVEEVINSMSENELYEEIMRLLVSGNSGAEASGQGNAELASIISAYLGDNTLSGKRAREASQKIVDTLEKQKRLLEFAETVGSKRKDKETVLENKALGAKNLEIPEKDSIELKYKEKEYRLTYGEEHRIPGIKYQVPDGDDVMKDPTNFLNPAVYDQDRYIRRLAELAADKGTDIISDSLSGVNSSLNTGKLSASARQYILKNTLMALVMARNKLERAMEVDRSRLPGGGSVLEGMQSLVQGGAAGLIGGGIESTIRAGLNSIPKFIDGIANGVDTSRPQNRPKGKKNLLTGKTEGTKTEKLKRLNKESVSSAQSSISNLILDNNNKIDEFSSTIRSISNVSSALTTSNLQELTLEPLLNTKDRLLEKKNALFDQINGRSSNLKSLLNNEVSFNTYAGGYFSGTGTALTLSDLCPETPAREISTLEDFREALTKSPYITTPSKLINRMDGNLTLDTNAYWEVVIEPFVNVNQNGGWSYLPSIAEINTENRVEHNHLTRYSAWIPINSFELQKSKLVSKTVGLYDGEISYPVSVEYTNELRISVVDDQYKSWRRYFQRCADVSTYFSEAHDYSFYSNGAKNYEAVPTAIDKSMICVSHYKNVTFRIRVYCMTPQYSTIKKFDLLCIMKDFSEEYSGEIEGGGTDLSISFSIVGENPDNSDPQLTRIAKSKLVEAVTAVGNLKESDDASSGIDDTYTIVSSKSHGYTRIKG